MIKKNTNSDRYEATVKVSNLLIDVLSNSIKTKKFSFLYTIHRNWKNIFGEEYSLYIKLNKVTLLNENKNANVYLISHNSMVSFFINNNKLYFLDKMNSLFGYRAVLNIYIQEIPKQIKTQQKHNPEIDEEKLNNFIKNSNIENITIKNKITELAKTILIKNI